MAIFERISERKRRRRFNNFADIFENAGWKNDGPWAIERALFYRGLAHDPANPEDPMEVPMAAGYASPAWSLLRSGGPEVDPSIERNWQILKAHERYNGDAPVHMKDGAPYKMFSGSEKMHLRIGARPEYRVKGADESIIAGDQLPILRDYMKGSINVDHGCGDGKKLRFLYEQLGEAARPTSTVLFDIARDVLPVARKEICSTGLPGGNVSMWHADMLSEHYWDLPVWNKLMKSDVPIVHSCWGATVNNFRPEKFQWLLGKIREKMRPADEKSGRPPDKAILSLAKTRHLPTLMEEYNHYFYKQFFTGGFFFGCHVMGIEGLDYNQIDCNIHFDIEHNHRITMNVVNKADQEVIWKPLRDLNRVARDTRAARFILPKTEMLSGFMHRWPENLLEEWFIERNLLEMHRLAYRPKNAAEQHVQHDISVLAPF